MTTMRVLSLCAFLCVVALPRAFADDIPTNAPSFTLRAVQSIPVALKRFRKDQPKAVEQHFQVHVREHAETVEVEFVPDASPVNLKCGDNDCEIGIDSGSSVYGYGLTYTVSKSTLVILKTERSR